MHLELPRCSGILQHGAPLARFGSRRTVQLIWWSLMCPDALKELCAYYSCLFRAFDDSNFDGEEP
jgi:hypothetical protein